MSHETLQRKTSSLGFLRIRTLRFRSDEITQHFLASGSQRVVCTVNGAYGLPSSDDLGYVTQVALIPHGSGQRFINMTKAIRDKFGLKVGDEVSIKLEKDDSKYGIFLCEEMEELLEQDPEGSAYFHKLTAGKQRSLLHIVAKPKSSNLRLTKSLAVLNYLKDSAGKLDFRDLIDYIRDFQKR